MLLSEKQDLACLEPILEKVPLRQEFLRLSSVWQSSEENVYHKASTQVKDWQERN